MSESEIEIDRRTHDLLRDLVDETCEGILPCIADKVRMLARKAYYLGCADGVSFVKDTTEDQKMGMRHNHEA